MKQIEKKIEELTALFDEKNAMLETSENDRDECWESVCELEQEHTKEADILLEEAYEDYEEARLKCIDLEMDCDALEEIIELLNRVLDIADENNIK